MASNLIELNPLLTGEELVEFLNNHSSPEAREAFPRRPDEPSIADLALASVLAPAEGPKPLIRVQSIGGRGISLWKDGALLSGFTHDLERATLLWSNAEQGHFTVGTRDKTGAEYLISPLRGAELAGNVLIDIHHWK